jgi:hypothetical protein
MQRSYEQLKMLVDFYHESGVMPHITTFLELLKKHNVALSFAEGTELYAHIYTSPTDKENIALGIRNMENGKEDFFIFEQNESVECYYLDKTEKQVAREPQLAKKRR